MLNVSAKKISGTAVSRKRFHRKSAGVLRVSNSTAKNPPTKKNVGVTNRWMPKISQSKKSARSVLAVIHGSAGA